MLGQEPATEREPPGRRATTIDEMGSRGLALRLFGLAPIVALACAADPGDGPKSDAAPIATFDAGAGSGNGDVGTAPGNTPEASSDDGTPDATIDAASASGGEASTASPPPSCPTCPLQVDYLTIDTPGGSGMPANAAKQIQFQLDIVNKGTMPQALSELTARYWFTAEGDTSLMMECYYQGPLLQATSDVAWAFTSLTQGSTPPKTSTADTYLEISFTGTSAVIPAMGDTGDLKLSVNDTGYQTLYDETNDYSFVAGDTVSNCLANDMNQAPSCPTSVVTLYRDHVLVWGTEPGGAQAPAGDP
jgi:cellulose binding protein with CBM3 domain